jgi:hypothetical protein
MTVKTEIIQEVGPRGVTITELAAKTGRPVASLRRTSNALVKQGLLRKEDGRLLPPERPKAGQNVAERFEPKHDGTDELPPIQEVPSDIDLGSGAQPYTIEVASEQPKVVHAPPAGATGNTELRDEPLEAQQAESGHMTRAELEVAPAPELVVAETADQPDTPHEPVSTEPVIHSAKIEVKPAAASRATEAGPDGIPYRSRTKPCKTCGALGFHHCCSKCGASATGIAEMEALFGFRKMTSKAGPFRTNQPQCRACRKVSARNSELKKKAKAKKEAAGDGPI